MNETKARSFPAAVSSCSWVDVDERKHVGVHALGLAGVESVAPSRVLDQTCPRDQPCRLAPGQINGCGGIRVAMDDERRDRDCGKLRS
jgi:hypothetical protein